MIYIGIDPGERYTGIALMQTGERTHLVQTGVIDGKRDMYASVDLIKQVFDRDSEILVVAEDYRVRPVGHQKFTAANTARLLGALEYVTIRNGSEWELEPAGDPDKELELLGISSIIERWRKSWPDRTSKNWHHARAAWRVLARFLLKDEPELIESLKLVSVSKSKTSYTIPGHKSLWSPPARWA